MRPRSTHLPDTRQRCWAGSMLHRELTPPLPSPPFLPIPVVAAQTVPGSMLPLLPRLILVPGGWAAGWLCYHAGGVTAPACLSVLAAPSWAASCPDLDGLRVAKELYSSLTAATSDLNCSLGKPVPEVLPGELLHLLLLLALAAGCSSSVLRLSHFAGEVALSGKSPAGEE